MLPLGDFSLMKDIPGMYLEYQKVANHEDAFDFIGDYLLHGKELLGHNKHNKGSKGSWPLTSSLT